MTFGPSASLGQRGFEGGRSSTESTSRGSLHPRVDHTGRQFPKEGGSHLPGLLPARLGFAAEGTGPLAVAAAPGASRAAPPSPAAPGLESQGAWSPINTRAFPSLSGARQTAPSSPSAPGSPPTRVPPVCTSQRSKTSPPRQVPEAGGRRL